MNKAVTPKHWFVVALAILFTLIFGDRRVAFAAPGAIVVMTTPKQQPVNSSACYNIGDADARTYCLARSRGESSQCYSIQRADLRTQCLAEVRK